MHRLRRPQEDKERRQVGHWIFGKRQATRRLARPDRPRTTKRPLQREGTWRPGMQRQVHGQYGRELLRSMGEGAMIPLRPGWRGLLLLQLHNQERGVRFRSDA